ncbi:hypothetical protein [uncultured Psychroserpens sp.]|uniref:hypothetical protein n=1 Tax=uncultured Psychroserpens sp. TaxID=255436 RepID=UPI00260F8A55|nr:hypothetical protein [uncultured Psychroserpens sp.]
MNPEETYLFNQLKANVVSKYLATHSTSSNVKDWNGDDIALFQEDLFSEVKAKVSEKWFYTYFKNEVTKLPRIDMLNMLSNYIGYENWNAFKSVHISKMLVNKKKKIFVLPLIFMPILVVFVLTMNRQNKFQFCFIDNLSNANITEIPLDIKILQNQQSPLYFKTDSLGCFTYKTKEKVVRFVVSSPYHKTDTIIRSIDTNKHNIVRLNSDDYALILKYYTEGNVKDWTKHKRKLEKLFDDDAQIYRLYDNNIGVELLSKNEFIRTLTLPTENLKRITILDKAFENEKIVSLKFVIR